MPFFFLMYSVLVDELMNFPVKIIGICNNTRFIVKEQTIALIKMVIISRSNMLIITSSKIVASNKFLYNIKGCEESLIIITSLTCDRYVISLFQ